jgi:Thioredoxin-like
MYPHERSLVKKLADKPFALVGVNSDSDMKKLKERMKQEKITWPSFANGDTSGPISTQWRVRGWPTIYILDAKGVIRYQSLGADEDAIDAMLKKLLAELGRPVEGDLKSMD